MLNNIIQEQLHNLPKKKVNSPAVSKEQIIRAFFFSNSMKKSIKSLSEGQIISSIRIIEQDYGRYNKPHWFTPPSAIERTNDLIKSRRQVENKIIQANIIPMLLPQWLIEEQLLVQRQDIRQFRIKGLGFSQPSYNQQLQHNMEPIFQPQQTQKQTFFKDHQFQKASQQNKRSNNQESYIERQLENYQFEDRPIEATDFDSYYNQGMKCLYEQLPQVNIFMTEFESINSFVQCNFVCTYYLSRFYFKNFDLSKIPFSKCAQNDKYYSNQLIENCYIIFPQVETFAQNDWFKKFQNQYSNFVKKSFDQKNNEKHQYFNEEQKQEKNDGMIEYKDWMKVFKKVYKEFYKSQYDVSQDKSLELSFSKDFTQYRGYPQKGSGTNFFSKGNRTSQMESTQKRNKSKEIKF